MVEQCPACGSPYIAGFGAGTQKMEEFTKIRFPDARILRMDADTTAKKGGHEAILEAFANREADILIGTQMIVKGHDFPGVTLVGILAADLSLNTPDYRSAERTFQLLTQAAGRAGRAGKPGDVVIQTYRPEHYACLLYTSDFTADDIHYVREHDFVGVEFQTHGRYEHDLRVGIPGKFNVDNALAAAGVCSFFDLPKEKVCHALEHIQVDGRMEIVYKSAKCTVIVDYAHNADVYKRQDEEQAKEDEEKKNVVESYQNLGIVDVSGYLNMRELSLIHI